MTTLSTVLISGASDELTARIEQLIRGQAELSLVQTVAPDAARDEQFKAKLVWIELESNPEGNVELLEQLIKSHPNTFFVVSKEDLEPELVKRAMQVGALDFLDHKGWAAQIRSVVRRIMAKEFGSKPTSPGSPATNRQTNRQAGGWGQLGNVKVPPNSTGFRRVEPNRASASPQPVAPKPVAPAKPAAPKLPEPEPEPQDVSVEEEQAQDPPYEEPAQYDGSEDTQPEFPEEEPEQASEGDESFRTENQVEETSYAEAEYPSGDAAQAEYAESGQAGNIDFSREEVEGYPPLEEEAQSFDSPSAYGDAENQDVQAYDENEESFSENVDDTAESGSEFREDDASEDVNVSSDDANAGSSDENSSSDDEKASSADEALSVESENKIPAAPVKPAPKARWDDLDSIISKGSSTSPKPEAEKPASKWGELGNIQTPKAVPKIPSSSEKKWSDLDAIVAPKSSSSSDAPAATGKWGDLDSIGAAKSQTEDVPGAEEQSAPGKWGDLDSIGTSKAKAESDSDEPASKWGDLDAIGTPKAKTESEPAEPGNKWGNLDSIGSKSGSGLKSNTRSFIKPKAPDEGTTSGGATGAGSGAGSGSGLGSGKSKWGDLESIGTGVSPAADAGSARSKWDDLGIGPAEPAQDSTTGGSKWGDLDGLGAGSSTPAEPSGGAGVGKWGNLDAIGTPAAEADSGSAFKNRFGKKAPGADAGSENGGSSGGLGAARGGGSAGAGAAGAGKWGNLDAIGSGGGAAKEEGNKWGDLNSIPTPKAAQEAGGQWSDLDSIPTPKTQEAGGPVLVEGALPKATSQNLASTKWKTGMSTDLSTGAREMVQMGEKLKETKISIKFGWNNVNIFLAAAIIASVGYLSVQFFTYPEPPTTTIVEP